MTGLVRNAALLTAAGLLVASAAFAGVPSAATSITPACITLVGNTAGVPDVAGTFSVTVKDLAGNVLNGASVVIDFAGCTDIAICSDQLDANATVNCASKTTRKFTDALGQASFVVLGGSNGANNATTLLHGAKIFANGVLIGSPTAAVYDLDGANGVAINDLSVWLGDFGSAQAWGRSEYDCNGSVGINDLAIWLGAFGSAASAASCAVACP